MPRRRGRGPVAWQKDDEDHGGDKCIGEPEAAPYPERKDGPGGGHQALGWRIGSAGEKCQLYSHAEKNDRADGERFLDTVAIKPRLGNGDFGSRVADRSED